MNKKTIAIGGIAIAVVLGLMISGRVNGERSAANRAGEQQNAKASVLSASEKSYDFGTISMKDGLVERRFTITNKTSDPIELSSMYTSCMCTTSYLETPKGEKGPFRMQGMGYVPPVNEPIEAGGTREVKVVYDPNAHGPAGVGAIDRFVYLVDGSGGMMTLEIKALVTP